MKALKSNAQSIEFSEDLSPTRNLTGITFKNCFFDSNNLDSISTMVCFTFSFHGLILECLKDLPARAIHLGFALTLVFLNISFF